MRSSTIRTMWSVAGGLGLLLAGGAGSRGEELAGYQSDSVVLEASRSSFGEGLMVDILFPVPMVGEDRVVGAGELAASTPAGRLRAAGEGGDVGVARAEGIGRWLRIEPPLAARLQWVDTDRARVVFDGVPEPGLAYRLLLMEGVRDEAGRAVPGERELGILPAPPFGVVARRPQWIDLEEPDREPVLHLQFSGDIDVEEVAALFSFRSDEGVGVPARVRLATAEDGELPLGTTLKEEFMGEVAAFPAEGGRASAVVVVPARPLPLGENWRLEVADSLMGVGGGQIAEGGYVVRLGHIRPVSVRGVWASNPYDMGRSIEIGLSKRAAKEVEGEGWREWVRVVPEPAGLEYELRGATLRLAGEFQLGELYRVEVMPGLPGHDGTELLELVQREILFEPNPAYVALPTEEAVAQWSGGLGYRVVSANVRRVRMRAKLVPSGSVVGLLEDYQAYGEYEDAEGEARFRVLSYDEVAGAELFDRVEVNGKPLDESEVHEIEWREVLEGMAGATVFLQVEAESRMGLPGAESALVAQAVLQLSDLGVVWKGGGGRSTAYVFSARTGEGLAGAELVVWEGGRALGRAVAGADGVVALPELAVGGEAARWLEVSHGGGQLVSLMGASGQRVPRYYFDVNLSWDEPGRRARRASLFTERPVYRPGETAYVRGYVRDRSWGETEFPAGLEKGVLRLIDPQGRAVAHEVVDIDERGHLDAAIVLPEGRLGYHFLLLGLGEQGEGGDVEGGYVSLLVEDYRPNTFEVRVSGDEVAGGGDIRFGVEASYYLGKELAEAAVGWYAMVEYEELVSADHPEHIFGDDGAAHAGVERGRDQGAMELGWYYLYGEGVLGAGGGMEVSVPNPGGLDVFRPRRVMMEAEVTDINGQTIVGRGTVRLAGAPFYVGVRDPGWGASAGEEIAFDLVALGGDGAAYGRAVSARVTVERVERKVVKVVAAGGVAREQEEIELVSELEREVALGVGGARGELGFVPGKGGTYVVTVEAEDDLGQLSRTRFDFSVYGPGAYWSSEGGIIDLVPAKARYLPGESVELLVRSPVAGRALVTVEDQEVLRHMLIDISPESPLVEVSLDGIGAGEVYLSVLVVRGAEGSPHRFPMPEYHVGYCQVRVDDPSREIVVRAGADVVAAQPGDEVEVWAEVTDVAGLPMAGVDVTLYVVDEGVLSLMGGGLPDPGRDLLAPDGLAVQTQVSLADLFEEDPAAWRLDNKGRVVGGGGFEEGQDDLRENFVACPLWVPGLLSDAGGKVRATLSVPDGLTRYRIVAVAAAGVDRFGAGAGEIEINKPLMIEPSVPRFAHVGDEIWVKGVVHNQTGREGLFRVALKTGELAVVAGGPRFGGAAAAGREISTGEVEFRLADGETASVSFPAGFRGVGAAEWEWSVRGEGVGAASDGVVSRLEVGHPTPSLKAVRHVRLGAGERALMEGLADVILEGEGELSLMLSRSRLSEGQEALDYLLRYPYGCAEQTTSATLPWIILTRHADALPQLKRDEGEVRGAIQAGVDQLLAMQTASGGLGYWAGASEDSLWASGYGGLALVLARGAGARVADQAMEDLLGWLSGQLVEAAEEAAEEEGDEDYRRADLALALYTLGKAGRLDMATANRLIDRYEERRDGLARELAGVPGGVEGRARAAELRAQQDGMRAPGLLFALALAEAGDRAGARRLVDGVERQPGRESLSGWRGLNYERALLALAEERVRPGGETAEKAFNELMANRGDGGHWGNTFANCWALLALAAGGEGEDRGEEEREHVLRLGGEEHRVRLASGETTAELAVPYLGGGQAVLVGDGGVPLFARARLEVRPRGENLAGLDRGFRVTREYRKLMMDGSTVPAKGLEIGEMVLVTVRFQGEAPSRHLVVDDPLPAIFEAINPEFVSSGRDLVRGGAASGAEDGHGWWSTSRRELRVDRALFFRDGITGEEAHKVQYVARVIAEGRAVAPPTKVEVMYEPERFGLSGRGEFTAEVGGDGRVGGVVVVEPGE